MKNKIISIAKECGIEDVGFCSFSLLEDKLLECRAKDRLPKGAKTVILFLFPYKVKEERPDKISRYAAVPDYHRICEKYLQSVKTRLQTEFKDNKFEIFIDNSPIPEVFAAACAGLGLRGENNLLISKKWGSWCFIGEIVTDLEILSENSFKECTLCGVCKRKCPAASGREKCLSAISQKKKVSEREEISSLKDNNIIWGCDICAENCPLNKNSRKTYIKEFIEGYRNFYSPDEDISGRAYEWRGKGVVLRNFEILNNSKINE
ncbi:MAG: epoxyqueuosine reductase [Clostridia bacterium]|nr:epoxyqueuosine reductase [Clostridia bacterium]